MAWVRLDDVFTDHPKIVGLPDASFRLHIHALCYASRLLTDGLISRAWLTGGKGRSLPKAIAPLVAAGLWVEQGHDFRIHDYLRYQPSRSSVEQVRDKAADRMKRAREVRENKSRSSQEVRSTPSHPIPSHTTTTPPASRAPSLIARRNLNAAYEHPRFDVPQVWHARRVSGLRDGESGMLLFYKQLAAYVDAHPGEDTEPRLEWLTRHFDAWVRARQTSSGASDVDGVEATRAKIERLGTR
jgi:hypothetical protein